MLYLGIDQHARQITISLRDERGDVLQARQVSTQPDRVNAFFQWLTHERLQEGESFVAVLEVRGFNDRLIRLLRDYRCHQVILIQLDDRKKCKTDRRDAAARRPRSDSARHRSGRASRMERRAGNAVSSPRSARSSRPRISAATASAGSVVPSSFTSFPPLPVTVLAVAGRRQRRLQNEIAHAAEG